MLQKFLDKFRALGAQNAHLVKSDLSRYEKHTDALWVRDDSDVYVLGKDVSREVSHVHNQTDYSAHVVLAPKDAVQVIQKGWGQFHGLAGKLLPQAYVLLYSPRNDDEIDLLLEIVRASIGYMTQTDSSGVEGVGV